MRNEKVLFQSQAMRKNPRSFKEYYDNTPKSKIFEEPPKTTTYLSTPIKNKIANPGDRKFVPLKVGQPFYVKELDGTVHEATPPDPETDHFIWYQEPLAFPEGTLFDLKPLLSNWWYGKKFDKNEVYAFMKTLWQRFKNGQYLEQADVVKTYGNCWYRNNTKDQLIMIGSMLGMIDEIERKIKEHNEWLKRTYG